MFGPYRTPPELQEEETRSRPEEEVVLALAMLVIGGLRVVVAVATRETWGLEATAAAFMCAGGLGLLVRGT